MDIRSNNKQIADTLPRSELSIQRLLVLAALGRSRTCAKQNGKIRWNYEGIIYITNNDEQKLIVPNTNRRQTKDDHPELEPHIHKQQQHTRSVRYHPNGFRLARKTECLA